MNTEALLAQFRATPLLEWLAVALGAVYILLIMRRQRWGWLAGGASSLILAWLAARTHLPMQAGLQLCYVIAAIYGWRKWSPEAADQRIGTWHWQGHALACIGALVVSLMLAQFLGQNGYSAWPFLDSLVACLGLLATWLVARVCVENWVYWILIDMLSIYLYAAQGMVVAALLFVIYLVISIVGLTSWWRTWRKGAAAT